MPLIINMYCMKVNSISGNGSVTVGEATHNSHSSKSKSQGITSSYGDTSPVEAFMENIYIDPDVNDQTDIGTSDNAYVGARAGGPPPSLY
ncbi:spore germination protein [Bacillus infantis]|uniref:spore germination protein n=1 Tax=Bacillus TaxID=1386 RepID=UPI001CD293E7|nr:MULTISPECIES: spore germination protein [Bacillus]MCA1038287.1 spore germination protein [Bacillus infantis]MDT0163269.1 spore germination protein [Bacillus sp. AG4(2022)]